MAISGDVKSLIQANNGHVLAGTNNSARIYRSSDNGQNWTQVVALGSGSDSVNAFAKVASTGYLVAAVSGSSTAQGIWRSTDSGASWTKVFTHPSGAGNGYYDITAIQSGSNMVAVGAATAFPFSPVIYSNNQGSSWSYVSISSYNQPQLAVSSYPEGVLFTAYPGEPYAQFFAFFGSDTYYTAQGGVTQTGSAIGFGTVGGGAGNGGLDMASYLFNDGSGNYRRRAVWAVKSTSNTADTEIWMWPSAPTGPFQFAKVATIASENFRGLYVDPTPAYTTTARTIWAGGNGTIYVSYNGGYTWTAATTAPTGQIYSFVRTSSGVLIAGGASGEIFLFSGTGSEGGNTGGTTPGTTPGTDSGVVTSKILGREETCENEVYAGNKFAFSNITHVFHYNGSTYTSLQFGSEPPYELLGSVAATNKAVYFGSKTNDTNVPGGTFSNIVFDITQGAKNITVVWEYWNGSSWATLTTQDNTDQFRNEGVGSVTWTIPTGWATTTVNSIVGYFVRARITVVSSGSQTPIHGNRYIYTSLLPYVEINEDQVKGDLPALARIKWTNRASYDVERMICGLRSLDRGENFNAYVNISDAQAPFGVTVSLGSAAGIAWQTDKQAPTGRSLIANLSSSGDLDEWIDLATITLSTTIARDYYGYFRALLRCYYNNASAQVWNLRIQLRVGSGGGKFTTKTVYPTTLCQFELLDFEQLIILNKQISSMVGNISDQLELVVQGYCTTLSKPLTLYDVVLIPTDEWALDAIVPETISAGSPEISTNYYLDIDSIANPKVNISVVNRNSAGLNVSQYQAINNGPVILQKNVSQRYWFVHMSYENYWKANPEGLGSVQVFKQQQYLGFRGKN